MDITPILINSSLFKGLTENEIKTLLPMLEAKEMKFEKDAYILHLGKNMHHIGILIDGAAEVFRWSANGANNAISLMFPGSVFGDVLGISRSTSPVSITAIKPCTVLFLPHENFFNLKTAPENAKRKLLNNLLHCLSDKYFDLSLRIDILLMKTLRQKIALYLVEQSKIMGSDTFLVPYTRIKLANYLGCERSALSRELSMMNKDGLLETYKQSFKLLNKQALIELCI